MENLLTQLKSSSQGKRLIAHSTSQSLTTADLIERCERLSELLTEKKIRVLALHGDNSINWLIIDLACQQAEICLIPLPTFFSKNQLEHIFDTAPIDAILSMQDNFFISLLTNKISNSQETILSGYHLLILKQASSSNSLPKNTQKITFTSGSTGKPKGVCLSSHQLLEKAKMLAETIELKNQRHLCLLPLSTLLENVAGLYMPLLSNGDVIIPSLLENGFYGSSSLDCEKFCQSISHHKPSSIILTPQLLTALISAVEAGWSLPTSLEFIAVGGSKLSQHLLTQAHNLALPVYEGYGLSECGSVISLNTARHNKPGSCGKPLAHLNITLDDNEIIVSGNTMLGYLGDSNSWNKKQFRTGDLGSLSNDGYLTINGRKKNLLISSFGRNINPEWVESEILSHPSITECIVLGDEKPYCIALLSTQNAENNDAALQQLIDISNARLPDYARVKRWHRLSDPLATQKELMTPNGRPRRQAIEAQYQHHIESLYS